MGAEGAGGETTSARVVELGLSRVRLPTLSCTIVEETPVYSRLSAMFSHRKMGDEW